MSKPNRNSSSSASKEISQEEQNALDVIDAVEYVDGYNASDLQFDFNF